MERNRRLGILTHHYIKNYGAFLQAYALQETLTGLDPSADVEIIDYINARHYLLNLRPFLISRPRSRRFIQALRLFFEDKMQLYQFYKAKRHLRLSSRCWNADDINERHYDAIVIGSDEVWSMDSSSLDSVKFGVGLRCSNLISYAPSVGSLTQAQELPAYVPDSLRRFTRISVRDSMTRSMVERFQKDPVDLVLDPTFLMDFNTLTEPDLSLARPCIVAYLCPLDTGQARLLREFAGRNGLLIYGAGCPEDWFDRSMVNLSPFSWVDLFSRAQYVVTGTFHGVVFAIKAHKKFVAFSTQVNRTEKIRSLLSLFGLENRLVENPSKDEICECLVRDIDYEAVQRGIDDLKQKSMAFLRESLAGSVKGQTAEQGV